MNVTSTPIALALVLAALAPATAAPWHRPHHRVHQADLTPASVARRFAPSYGSPPQNMYDPTRPYGGQAAIRAPMGTQAYEEQANQRRYFCRATPERC